VTTRTSAPRLRYYLHDSPSSFRFKLAGSLAGEDVTELGQCWLTASSSLGSRAFVVEIEELTAVDEQGHGLLRQWHEQGARFLARSAQARTLAEKITGRSTPPPAPTRRPPGGWSLQWAALASAVLLSLLLPVTVLAGGAAGNATLTAPPSPKLVLARYSAILEQSSDRLECRKVALDIEASLPKLARRGRLRAIREMVAPGRAEYRDLEMEGDRTVRQQVIARYLSADAQAAALPSGSVAVSPANYRFRYVGSIGSATALTYVFQISPRHKRAGLIRGELWIDSASGLATRKVGRIVKSPSVFVRRIDVVEDIYIRDEAPYLRVTHLEINTRVAGSAELTIREHICAPTTLATEGGPRDGRTCSATF
jgi:hypothetical protein